MTEDIEIERAVQLIKPVKKENDNGETVTSFKLETEVLEKLLLKEDVGDKKIVVISVTGAFRTGKSFLLNYLLLYLRKLEAESNDDWLTDDHQKLTGFTWRRGADPETAGIMAWNKIFVIPNGEGEKVGVLLLDTQGAFDDDSDVKDVTLIFSLSTMISSCQIYNIRGNLQSDNLQHLQLFTEFGRQAMEEAGPESIPFQDLLFLVRDWNLDDTEGYEGGESLLKKRLEITQKMNDEKRELRQHIKSCFKSIKAFLMPHPGDIVRKGEFQGETSKLHPDFIQNLKILVPSLLDKPSLKMDPTGNLLTATQLVDYFKRYTEIFQQDDMPETVTILEATAEANHHMAVQKATNIWKEKAKLIIPEKPGYLSEKSFSEKTENLLAECLGAFDGTKRMLSSKYGDQYRGELSDSLKGFIEDMQKLNDEKRAAKLLQTPLILFMSVLICWIAISILELMWLSPVAAWINILSMFLIFCIVLWVIDQYQGGLGLPIQENIDLLSEELKLKLLIPTGHAMTQLVGRVNPDAAVVLTSLTAPKEKKE